MTTFTASTQIDVPQERVWEMIADLGGVVNFHPFVTQSYYTSQQKEGAGASRICEFGENLSVEEKAIEWREGESYTVAVDFVKGMKPPIRDMRGTMTVKPDGNGGSIASILIHYQPRFGIVGQLMDRFMIRSRYETMIPGMMQGLKHYAETGEVVNPKVLKRLQPLLATA